MKVWKKQKGLLVRTMICAVSLAAACFYGNSLPAQAAPRAQETGERVVIVIDPGHGGDNEGTLEGPAQEKKMTMVTALAMYEELTKYDNVDVYLTHTDDVTMSLADRHNLLQTGMRISCSVFITTLPWIMICSDPKSGSLPYSLTTLTVISSAGNRCSRCRTWDCFYGESRRNLKITVMTITEL